MIGEAVEQIKTVNPKEIEAMISNNLQVLVTKQVIPKISQFVNEMKIKMTSFVQDLEKKNSLDSVVSELDELKREIEEMKGMLTSLAYTSLDIRSASSPSTTSFRSGSILYTYIGFFSARPSPLRWPTV